MGDIQTEILKKPKVSKDLVWERRGRTWLLVDVERASWSVVNDMGGEIVRLCNGRRSREEIAKELSTKYEQDFDEVCRDVTNFIEKVEEDRIVYFGRRRKSKLCLPEVPPRDVFFEVTYGCNLRCSHCYLGASESKEGELTTQEIKEFIDGFAKAGGKEFTFTGGEPLMRKDIMDLLEYARSRDLSTKLITNGTLINQRVARTLVRFGTFVQVSMDGASSRTHDRIRGEGTLEAAKRGLEYLLSADCKKTAISVTPMNTNLNEIPKLIEFAADLGVTYIHFSRLAKQGRAKKEWMNMRLSDKEEFSLYELLRAEKEKHDGKLKFSGNYGHNICARLSIKAGRSIGCNMGENLRIDPEGNVYPCAKLGTSDYCLGNVRTETFKEIMTRLDSIRALFFERLNKIEDCRMCKWKYFCGGGCMADALLEYGTIWHEDPRCRLRRMFIYQYITDCSNGKAVQNV